DVPITLESGSVIRAVGTPEDQPDNIKIGSKALRVNGNGSLIAVSNGEILNVQRENVRGERGIITLKGADGSTPGALLQGKSVSLDTTGDIVLEKGATITAPNMEIGAESINLGSVTGSPGGFVVTPDAVAQISKAQVLTLRSGSQGINFYGS